jgi:NAD(P)-dependent dehydrogenase (short-subunit alcohol dehydrogenase family)
MGERLPVATLSRIAAFGASMKILVVGANGTIGKAVVDELKGRHDILSAGRSHGDHRVNLTDLSSIRDLFAKVGKVDAVVSTAGNVHFGPLLDMTPEQLQVGLSDKLMGQVHLALEAAKHLNPGGSVTLVAGTLSQDPIRYGASASLVNGALESFVRAAALEFPAGMRINVVSPTVLRESMPAYGPYFPGSEGVPGKLVGLAFAKSVEGAQTGQVYYVE